MPQGAREVFKKVIDRPLIGKEFMDDLFYHILAVEQGVIEEELASAAAGIRGGFSAEGAPSNHPTDLFTKHCQDVTTQSPAARINNDITRSDKYLAFTVKHDREAYNLRDEVEEQLIESGAGSCEVMLTWKSFAKPKISNHVLRCTLLEAAMLFKCSVVKMELTSKEVLRLAITGNWVADQHISERFTMLLEFLNENVKPESEPTHSKLIKACMELVIEWVSEVVVEDDTFMYNTLGTIIDAMIAYSIIADMYRYYDFDPVDSEVLKKLTRRIDRITNEMITTINKTPDDLLEEMSQESSRGFFPLGALSI